MNTPETQSGGSLEPVGSVFCDWCRKQLTGGKRDHTQTRMLTGEILCNFCKEKHRRLQLENIPTRRVTMGHTSWDMQMPVTPNKD
jgi:hypothetical protein